MLKQLSIKNFALIENMEFQFSNGLAIITGETGAGKSILLGALGLVTGQRAETSFIRDKEKKTIIEAIFDVSNYELREAFEVEDVDYEEECIVRREIKSNGQSRGFINDMPVSLKQMKNIGDLLLDIHSQHQNLLLSDKDFQMNMIDIFAQNTPILKEYNELYIKYKTLKKSLEILLEEQKQFLAEKDYLQFQFDELYDAKIELNEIEQLEEELKILENAEEIKVVLSAINHIVEEDEINVLQLLSELKIKLGSIEKLGEKYSSISERLKSVIIELNDISAESQDLSTEIEYNPERILAIQDRLNLLNGLKHKHRCDSEADLIELLSQIEEKLLKTANFDDKIEKIKLEIKTIENELERHAIELSKRRNTHAPTLTQKIESILKLLGMNMAEVKMEISELENFNEKGKNSVSLLLKSNKGGEFYPINKIASGGEISRLMLSIKSILAQAKSLPTVIFDEIDTGVSGEVAAKLGNIIEEMGKSMQVVAITHLPQIAARGNQHFKVYKDNESETTVSKINKLNKEERIMEIAQMLSSDKITDISLANAQQLLNQ
jgi:DNA repair protein RecN (Recombination protein N)